MTREKCDVKHKISRRFQLVSDENSHQIGHRTISVTLPRGVNYEMFDVALSSALRFMRLDQLAPTSFGKTICAETGVHPSKLKRQTAYGMGRNELRISPCKEIICFRPRIEIARLAGLIELTLLQLILPEVVVIKTLQRTAGVGCLIPVQMAHIQPGSTSE